MRNLVLSATLSALSAGTLLVSAPAAPAGAAVSANIDIHIGERYPSAYFVRQPRTILIPETRVYYVNDLGYDLYRCDNWWYLDDGGYWYRAASYRGPFIGISFSSVPRSILNVPVAYRHQPYRPRYTPYNDQRWRDDSYSVRRTYSRDQNRNQNRDQNRDQSRQWWDSRNWDGQNHKVLNTAPQPDWNKNAKKSNQGNGHSHGRGNGRGHGNK